MPEGLLTIDGKPIDVEAAQENFDRLMAEPPEGETTDLPKKPAEPKAKAAPTKHSKPRTATRAAAKPAAAAPASPELTQRRTEGVAGILQMGAAACMAMDMRTPDTDLSWRADAVTLALNAEPFAKAVADTAANNAQFARIVDKITTAGPYAALVTAGLSMAAQIAANHGVKAATAIGAVPPDVLLSQFEQQEKANDGSAS